MSAGHSARQVFDLPEPTPLVGLITPRAWEDSALFLQRLDSRRREGRERAVGEPGEVIIVGRQRPDRLSISPP
jgi:hypothetical protein